MKTYIIDFAPENKDSFDLLLKKEKVRELRAAAPKYKTIKKGDQIAFTCEKERFLRVVLNVEHFHNFEELFQVYKSSDINPLITSQEEYIEKCFSFPNYKEKIAEFGLLVFTLAR